MNGNDDTGQSQPPPPTGPPLGGPVSPLPGLDPETNQPPPPTGPPVGAPPQAPGAAPADEPRAAWGPARVLAAVGVLLALLLVEVGVIAGVFDPQLDSLGSRLVLQAALAGTLVGVAFVAANPGAGLLAQPAALGLRRPQGKFIGPTLICYFGYLACALVIAALIAPEQEDVTRELGVDEGTLGAIVAGMLIVGVAPLTEEIFFRGFMFTGMRRALPFALAALVPSVVWGLFHFTGPDSWGVVLQLSVFGLWLSWLFERTGSLWPPIAVHALNNAIAFALLTA